MIEVRARGDWDGSAKSLVASIRSADRVSEQSKVIQQTGGQLKSPKSEPGTLFPSISCL